MGPLEGHLLVCILVTRSCAGEAVGRLIEAERLEPGAIPEGSSDPVVLLVKSASGDEEVGAAGANLRGVILRQSLPHLSHLGDFTFKLSDPEHVPLRISYVAQLLLLFHPMPLDDVF